MRRRSIGVLWAVLLAGLVIRAAAQPVAADPAVSLRFAVLGDFGTGDRPQSDIADRMWTARATFPFDLVLALGDNIYGRQEPRDFVDKFERPYARLLDAGVQFQAALGNHDRTENRNYPPYNMNGRRYYTFVRGEVRFVVLDTNAMDPDQLAWADGTLAMAREHWKIVYFHHRCTPTAAGMARTSSSGSCSSRCS